MAISKEDIFKDRFENVELIGSKDLVDLYRATDCFYGWDVAIKAYKCNYEYSVASIKKSLREIQAAERLSGRSVAVLWKQAQVTTRREQR